ncbi:MAG: FtsX-like permease family protein, partial [Pseudomonadota bacterium]
ALVAPGTQVPDGVPPPILSQNVPPGTLVVDIAQANRLLDQGGDPSALLLAPDQLPNLPPIAQITEGRLVEIPPRGTSELSRLTDSFHLNLTAFGFLSFVVGLFIVHSTIGLGFEQRRASLRTLRACGAPVWAIGGALVAEILLATLVAGSLGMVLGYVIAGSLLPNLALSLRGLYGAQLPGTLSLSPWWWAAGLGMGLVGAFAAASTSIWRAVTLPVLAPAQPQAWQTRHRAALRWQGLLALGLLLMALIVWASFGGLFAGFVLIGSVLTGCALLLPLILDQVLKLGHRRVSDPVTVWAWADTRQQLRGLSLALMALLLALSVNIGVGTMVDGFRKTFLGWLDLRLPSELYLGARDEAEAQRLVSFLKGDPRVTAILPIQPARSDLDGFPLTVYGTKDHATYRDNWPLLSALPEPWDLVQRGDHILISEQIARRFDLSPGEAFEVRGDRATWSGIVAGVYSDYGNTTGAAILSIPAQEAHWQEIERLRFALRVDPADVVTVQAELLERFDLGESQLTDQARLKAISREIFESTFTVTLALNALTLAVAGFSLFTALLTLSNMRQPQLAPLWALGVTRRRLGWIELIRMLCLAAFSAVLAIPLGLLLAAILTKNINVEAFGWELPLFLFPEQWLRLVVLALLTAGLAALWPVLRLRRMPPADLIRVFSHER